MIALDILTQACQILGMDEMTEHKYVRNVSKTLIEQDENGEDVVVVVNDSVIQEHVPHVRKMMDLLRVVVSEMAVEYLDLTAECRIHTVDQGGKNIIDLTGIPNIAKVLRVKDATNRRVEYTNADNHIVVALAGEYTVVYRYKPIFSSVTDVVPEYFFDVSTVIHGLCAYYCLQQSLFDEYERFMEIYKRKLENTRPLKKSVSMACRRWNE